MNENAKEVKEKETKQPKKPTIVHSLITFGVLVMGMAAGLGMPAPPTYRFQ